MPAYKVFTALFTQVAADIPIVTELQNTLAATVTWSYIGPGRYRGTASTPVFTLGKTYITNGSDWSGDGASAFPLIDASGMVGGNFQMTNISSTLIEIDIFNPAGVRVEASSILNGTTISLPEIRVYP